jgi:hypothetical protein
MDTLTIGTFLENQGFSDKAIDEYLEHHGVRGQRWGVKNTGSGGKPSPQQIRTRHGIAAVAGPIAVIQGAMVGRLLAKHFNLPVAATMIGSAAVTAAGMVVATKILKNHGQKKANEIANARKVLFKK